MTRTGPISLIHDGHRLWVYRRCTRRFIGWMSHVEGAFDKTLALSDVSPSAAMAWSVRRLGDPEERNPRPLDERPEPVVLSLPTESAEEHAERVMCAVCDVTGVSRERMRSRNRSAPVVLARMMAVYFIRYETEIKVRDIALLVGVKAPSTVTEAYGVMRRNIAEDRPVLSACDMGKGVTYGRVAEWVRARLGNGVEKGDAA